MTILKRINNYFNPPKNLSVFNIPVLIKKEEINILNYMSKSHTVYVEAYTDGFYYEKNRLKYFHVKEKDKEPVYIFKADLVFLTEEESDAS